MSERGSRVRPMTRALTSERYGQPVITPRDGTRVQLWQIDGWWAVWSPGPARSTVWLVPTDRAAHEVIDAVQLEGDQAVQPVVDRVWRGASGEVRAILVQARELRAGVNMRGEA